MNTVNVGGLQCFTFEDYRNLKVNLVIHELFVDKLKKKQKKNEVMAIERRLGITLFYY